MPHNYFRPAGVNRADDTTLLTGFGRTASNGIQTG